jgi:uncharacterized protein YndB with AHSA1/START domain
MIGPARAGSAHSIEASGHFMIEFQPSTSDDAIRQATGRTWEEWFQLLTESRMESRTHEEIVGFLENEHSVPSWWRQTITNNYEQKLGRLRDGMPEGFQIHVTRALAFPVETVYAMWADDAQRARWMRKADFEPTARKAPGTVRGKWLPNDSRLEVEVVSAGAGGCELRIVHRKLPNEEAALRMKDLWTVTIDRMVSKLESSR